jgi:hypothetical protein
VRRRPEQHWDDDLALATLRTAQVVAFGGVGFAGVKSPETQAFEYLRDAGSRVGPGVKALLRTATPAGKVYAAHLVNRVDREFGRCVWEELAAQPGEFLTGAGCQIEKLSLAGHARAQLAAPAPTRPRTTA